MTDLIKRISAVVDQFFANELQFTLLDISNKVKFDGGPFVRHVEVRDSSKPILDIIMKHNSVYEVHQIEVNTPHGKDVADLYTPYWLSPDGYINTSQVAAKPFNPVKYAPVTSTTTPVVTKSVQNTNIPNVAIRAISYKLVKPRLDGAVNIPNKLLEISGLDDRTGIDIINHPNSISIIPGNGTYIPLEFRISKTNLAKSNLNNKNVYICAFADKIVIAEK